MSGLFAHTVNQATDTVTDFVKTATDLPSKGISGFASDVGNDTKDVIGFVPAFAQDCCGGSGSGSGSTGSDGSGSGSGGSGGDGGSGGSGAGGTTTAPTVINIVTSNTNQSSENVQDTANAGAGAQAGQYQGGPDQGGQYQGGQ